MHQSHSAPAGWRGARRRLALVVAACAAVLAAVVAVPLVQASAATTGFVTRCGIHFCLGGRSYYFAGANVYDTFTYGGSYGDTETQWMDKARIDKHMAEMAADGVTVLRTWMFDHETWHGFEPSKGVYSEQQFSEFDYILYSAAQNNIRVIPVFENYWEAYGGIDTRLSWEGLPTGQANRWRFFNQSACPGCFTQYQNYVKYALNRTNHYTGVKYKDDPTVFAWELMNEPRYEGQGSAENVNGTTLRKWVDTMAGYIKSIDTNHMVGAGLEGHGTKYGFGGDEGNPFVAIQQSPYIDFTSAHPYPNEGWANLSLAQTITLINAWLSDSHAVVGKPFFLGEFNTQGVDRSTWWTSIYNDLQTQDADGSAFWWYPDAQAGGDNYSVKRGAPELSVFKAHSAYMVSKSGGNPSTSPSASRSASASPSPSASASPSRSPSASPSTSPSPSSSTSTGAGCTVGYSVNDWGGGFTVNVTVTNTGATAITGWTLKWTFGGNQAIGNTWNATVTQSGQAVTAVNMPYNATIAARDNVQFGFQAAYSGANAVPAQFTLNGTACAKV
ncbi:cellulose binding domain-containing protein [Dactylosporangium sp. NPDC048998]|uniref:cellulose binding domain-containing protein n=1 Tax=Dactylosporangium sp. NPDC048998 TaxID=3363976 RepID=UPI003717AADD